MVLDRQALDDVLQLLDPLLILVQRRLMAFMARINGRW
jgi:hypothetical protein